MTIAPLADRDTDPLLRYATAIEANLAQRLQFVIEIDRLKEVLRRTKIISGSRLENSAEHSWHLAMMALTLAPYAAEPIRLEHTLAMLLVHDLVEIDAGDTFAFDQQANSTKVDREQAAAERIFGLLPAAEGQALRALWDEFEAAETIEARFAIAIDRLEPLLCNSFNQGGTWRAHHVSLADVRKRMDPIRVGMPQLWPFAQAAIAQAHRNGWISEDPAPSE
ncbi:MAG: HD domain-containing protein [Roseiflexaceae bacterium]